MTEESLDQQSIAPQEKAIEHTSLMKPESTERITQLREILISSGGKAVFEEEVK